jgi:hypothetical protein
MIRNDGLEILEQLLFHLKVLDDRFHHQGAVSEITDVRRRAQAASGCLSGLTGHPALVRKAGELNANSIGGLFRSTLATVEKSDHMTRSGRNLSNTSPHGTSAHDGHHGR